MKNPKIYLLGASGHALSVIDALQSAGLSPIGYFDLQLSDKVDLPYLGKESEASFLQAANDEEAVFFPCVGNNKIRQLLTETIEKHAQAPFRVIHANTSVSQTATIAPYIFMGAGAIVNYGARIETGAIINTGAIVEHECVVGAFAHIGPGAVLCGNVSVGARSFIGANATIIQGIRIGKDAVIGAGSVVVRDVEDHATYIGAPAKFRKKNGE